MIDYKKPSDLRHTRYLQAPVSRGRLIGSLCAFLLSVALIAVLLFVTFSLEPTALNFKY